MMIAAIVAVLLLVVVAVFQIALALGAPFGAAAWGGQRSGVLPTPLRIASGVAGVVIYPILILVILAASGLIGGGWLPVDGTVAMWALAGLLALGSVLNFVSRSKVERFWGPVALVAAICCALIALGIG